MWAQTTPCHLTGSIKNEFLCSVTCTIQLIKFGIRVVAIGFQHKCYVPSKFGKVLRIYVPTCTVFILIMILTHQQFIFMLKQLGKKLTVYYFVYICSNTEGGSKTKERWRNLSFPPMQLNSSKDERYTQKKLHSIMQSNAGLKWNLKMKQYAFNFLEILVLYSTSSTAT